MADDREYLELRIHGVNNTKPEAMLGLDLDRVEKVKGDKLGSFWRPTAAGRATSKTDDDIELEAYSWGEMARNSVGGGSGIGKAIGVASRAGWALLLPFGLVNVAYWTRKVDDGPNPPLVQGESDRNRHGAATIRVAGLFVTMLMAVTASVIVLDVIAVQCFYQQQKLCTALPSFLDFLEGMGQARRLALLSLVPVLLILGLLLLSAATRARYEQPEPSEPPRPLGSRQFDAQYIAPDVEAATATYKWPLLAVDGFWSHRKITDVTARQHVAATAALVSIVTAMHVLLGFSASCEAMNTAVTKGSDAREFVSRCLTHAQSESPRAILEIGVVFGGLVVFGLILESLFRSCDYAVDIRAEKERATHLAQNAATPKRKKTFRTNWVPLIAAGALFAFQVVVLFSLDKNHDPEIRYLLGTSAAPTILLTLLVAIGLSALLWRLTANTRWPYLPNGFVLVVLGLVCWLALENTTFWRIVASAGILVLLVAIPVIRHRLASKPKTEEYPRPTATAWSGSAPGVFLLLASLLAMLLSSAVATATGNWLNGTNSASSLADGEKAVPVSVARCPYSCSTELEPPNLEIPLPYMWFGAICLPVMLVLIVVVVLTAACKSFRWRAIEPRDGTAAVAPGDGRDDGKTKGPPAVRTSVLQKRRFAAVAHRAEVYVGLLVATGTVGIIASIGVSAWGVRPERSVPNLDPTLMQGALNLGMLLLAGGGILAIMLAMGGSLVGGRPLGLAWDLMCFLPRAGHPLAPPCYAERAVPELSQRCTEWLGEEKPPNQNRAILLSAHSLGSVLAIAVLLSLSKAHQERVSLLTYGSQLRAYFGRIFPELLGPTVLGIQDCASSRLDAGDPWEHEIDEHPCSYEISHNARQPLVSAEEKVVGDSRSVVKCVPLVADKRSVVCILTSEPPELRWRNLWRRTDYLGFPMVGYPSNAIDEIALEIYPVDYLPEVQTHSNYPRSDTYRDARIDLLTQFGRVPPARPSAATDEQRGSARARGSARFFPRIRLSRRRR